MHIFNYLYQKVGDNIQIHTNGCDICIHDARQVANQLVQQGHDKDKKYILYNSCAVFKEREVENELILNLLKKAFPDHTIYVMGCDVNNRPSKYQDYDDNFTTHDINHIIYDFEPCKDVVEAEEPLIYVKVQDGCLHKCAYCIINQIRSELMSVPYSRIVEIIKAQIKDKEHPRVELAGTELTEYYDEETGYTLIELLENLSRDIPEVERFTLTSLDPNPAMTEYVIEFMGRHKYNFVPHLTLAVQSGSDKILRRMNRRHNVTRIRTLHELAKENGISLGWDVIVGFPGETEEDFQKTFELMKELRPLSHTIFAYSPRYGTPAYNFKDQVPEEEKQRRLKILEDFMEAQIQERRLETFEAFAEYSEEMTRYEQTRAIKNKVLDLITEGTAEEVNLRLDNVDDIAYIINRVNDNTILCVDFIPEKALECEIYINFFKEFIPNVPVVVTFPRDYEKDLKKFEKIYHCIAKRRVDG